MAERKEPWQKRVAPEIVAAIGKPRSGERMGQYFLRWKRYAETESQERLSRAFAARNDGEVE